MVPDTEMSFSGHVVTSERSDNDDHDDDNEMVGAECEQLKLSSPRESFQRDDDDNDMSQINNKIQIQPQPPSRNLMIPITIKNVTFYF